jgi:hypothetical protein
MSTPLEKMMQLVSAERQHMAAFNVCFTYFAALAEIRRRGYSDLFQFLPADLPQDCDDNTAARLDSFITDFIEKCPNHAYVGSAFHTLLILSARDDLKNYFISKLKFYYAQGDAFTVYQLCQVIEDCGVVVFRDEKGAFIGSRSSCEAERNMGVARRFLERLDGEQGCSI